MRFLSSRYRYIIDQGITRFLPQKAPELINRIRSPAAISPAETLQSANCARLGRPEDRRLLQLRNVRPRHVSALTWATSFGSNTRSRFMTPVCWRCFSRPFALFSPQRLSARRVSSMSTPLLAACNMFVKSKRCRCFRHVEIARGIIGTCERFRFLHWIAGITAGSYVQHTMSRKSIRSLYAHVCVCVCGTFWETSRKGRMQLYRRN